ncbi:hypothetical protein ACQP2T_38065 [Nonomuraea sp. CA-143628]|uniref:hypothetical protein n=1 Tax=Nonomuraea sp. CA-143628 TaxID=3239997 RepID=UPI003D8D7648
MGGSVRWSSLLCPRWLLPVMLVLGVWGMHTLGHLASHETSSPLGSYAPAHMEASEKAMPEGGTELIGQAATVGVLSGPLLGSGSSVWPDPTDVCLAVLPLIVALLIAVILAMMRPWPGAMAARRPWVGGVARSPPRRLAPALAGLSVMRT